MKGSVAGRGGIHFKAKHLCHRCPADDSHGTMKCSSQSEGKNTTDAVLPVMPQESGSLSVNMVGSWPVSRQR